MNEFSDALIDTGKKGKIPKEYDWFGFLIGEWDILYSDNHGTGRERQVKGEWIFSWVLDGTAIQDVFICPSRAERQIHPQPDATWGTTLRIFNPGTKAWDIFYGATGEAERLEAKKEGRRHCPDRNSRRQNEMDLFRYPGQLFSLGKPALQRRRFQPAAMPDRWHPTEITANLYLIA